MTGLAVSPPHVVSASSLLTSVAPRIASAVPPQRLLNASVVKTSLLTTVIGEARRGGGDWRGKAELVFPFSALIADLSNITGLDLSYNNFTGAIPSSLGGMESLEQLWLFNNLFNETIPSRNKSELGNPTNLEELCTRLQPDRRDSDYDRAIDSVMESGHVD